ncbi:MAG TPA: hypothetical protein VLL08_20070 [Kineosporiaceae bacterium]|nr:hypothetical protein [Kineosporiaceae bacterium]
MSTDRETAMVNRWSASSLVLCSQLALAVGLTVCVPLMPHFLFSSTMGGVSNFGVHARTLAPYTAGIVISAWLLLKVSVQLTLTGEDRALAMLCRITAALFLLNLISTYPYQVAPTWRLLHNLCAILLAVGELVGAVTLAWLLRDRSGYTVMAIAIGAFVVMALTQLGVLHVLFVAEVTTGVAFGVLLVRAARQASRKPCHWVGDGPPPSAGPRDAGAHPMQHHALRSGDGAQ